MRNKSGHRKRLHSVHNRMSHKEHIKYYKRRLILSLIFTLPLALLMKPLRDLILGPMVSYTLVSGTSLAFMSVIHSYGGWPFLDGMYKELTRKKIGMMTLVSLGITASFLYGFIEVFSGREPSMGGELAFLVLVMLTGH